MRLDSFCFCLTCFTLCFFEFPLYRGVSSKLIYLEGRYSRGCTTLSIRLFDCPFHSSTLVSKNPIRQLIQQKRKKKFLT
ncbi:hypothetical protein L873DRAFT_1185669 [Choiromyces venosus 120613-1]|uniref:Secreted protein n=1 Tax=Choiromyces venosus 120613-1 TaxID=1336337 RepID=A0A3N4K2Y0_9PEZI|nr:hypothetical protein L873DRAFT_1185669 [Choiromyces venosus 120613-1]